MTNSLIVFESALEQNLVQLCADLNAGKYKHGGYTHKIVSDKKRRDIYVATVRDRLVHRLLYDYLVPIIDPKLDYDVWSCRRGKGLHGGLERTVSLLGRYPYAWVWRADVQKFFDNVDHVQLRGALQRHLRDKIALDVLHEVIGSYCTTPQRGVPIGNLTSQIFANIYLHEFDTFIRHYLKPLGYVRYGDDFIMFAPSRETAYSYQERSGYFLDGALKLQLHNKNNIVVKARHGLHFLGHTIHGSGEALSKRTYRKIVRNLTFENAASYTGMKLTEPQRKVLRWLLLQQMP